LCDTSLKLPQSNLSFLVAHHADGQYQRGQFRDTFLSLKHPEGYDSLSLATQDFFFVTPWDASHWLDLSMVEVRDVVCRDFFSRFIKRANKFNAMFGRGKGFAEYNTVQSQLHLSGHVTKSYATTRFTSSAFAQFESIYKSYEALVRTYEKTRETSDDCEEMKYQIKGQDFCIDLCGVLDCLTPFKVLMVKCESLETPLWSITKWWPKVQQIITSMEENLKQVIQSNGVVLLNPELFPIMSKHFADLVPPEDSNVPVKFQNVQLEAGWLVEDIENMDDEPRRRKTQTINWKMRQPMDCLRDLQSVCAAVVRCTQQRYAKCVCKVAIKLGNCLDVGEIVSMICGRDCSDAMLWPRLREHGKREFFQFYEYVCSLPQVKTLAKTNPSLLLTACFSEMVLNSFHHVLYEVIWNNLGNCRHKWFDCKVGSFQATQLHALTKINSNDLLEDSFLFEFETSNCTAVLNVSEVFKSFYVDEDVYLEAGQEMCIALDVALAMGGCESVVESYYSVMKAHTMSGGQSNKSLVQRTNVDWCFPMPIQCRNTIKELSGLYLDGNAEYDLPRHKIPIFLDSRGRVVYKEGSKVLDKLAKRSNSFVLVASDKD